MNYVVIKILWKGIDILILSCNKIEKDVNYMNNVLFGILNKVGYDGLLEFI